MKSSGLLHCRLLDKQRYSAWKEKTRFFDLSLYVGENYLLQKTVAHNVEEILWISPVIKETTIVILIKLAR